MTFDYSTLKPDVEDDGIPGAPLIYFDPARDMDQPTVNEMETLLLWHLFILKDVYERPEWAERELLPASDDSGVNVYPGAVVVSTLNNVRPTSIEVVVEPEQAADSPPDKTWTGIATFRRPAVNVDDYSGGGLFVPLPNGPGTYTLTVEWFYLSEADEDGDRDERVRVGILSRS